VVDVVNPGFIWRFGTKVMNGLAAGGFMLLDRRGDFVDLFGALGDAIGYASVEELEAKIDRFVRTVERALALRR
jgi:hypothetical protein